MVIFLGCPRVQHGRVGRELLKRGRFNHVTFSWATLFSIFKRFSQVFCNWIEISARGSAASLPSGSQSQSANQELQHHMTDLHSDLKDPHKRDYARRTFKFWRFLLSVSLTETLVCIWLRLMPRNLYQPVQAGNSESLGTSAKPLTKRWFMFFLPAEQSLLFYFKMFSQVSTTEWIEHCAYGSTLPPSLYSRSAFGWAESYNFHVHVLALEV